MVKSTRIVIQLFDDRLFIFVVNVLISDFFYIIRKDNKIEKKNDKTKQTKTCEVNINDKHYNEN